MDEKDKKPIEIKRGRGRPALSLGEKEKKQR